MLIRIRNKHKACQEQHKYHGNFNMAGKVTFIEEG